MPPDGLAGQPARRRPAHPARLAAATAVTPSPDFGSDAPPYGASEPKSGCGRIRHRHAGHGTTRHKVDLIPRHWGVPMTDQYNSTRGCKRLQPAHRLRDGGRAGSGQLQDEAIAFKQVPLPAAPGLTNLDAPTRLQAALVKIHRRAQGLPRGAKNSQAFYTQFAAESRASSRTSITSPRPTSITWCCRRCPSTSPAPTGEPMADTADRPR